MPGMTLPPGFRFHPTDEELVDYYLKKRVKNIPIEFDVIADVDLYKCEPWDLPSKSKLPHGDNEWFFFSPRDRKYPNGSRTNRATEAGYWKATGRDRTVRQGTKTIGMKKTLVFYRGRAPHGERTDWLMHEYRLDGEEWENMNVPQDAYVLCRVFKKNGFGPPKNASGSGSIEEGDQVDSPGEVKSSTFADHDVKPSMSSLANLPPLAQPLSRADMVSVEEHTANGVDGFAARGPSLFSDDPFVHNGSFRIHFNSDTDAEGFFVDEGLDKMRNDEESLEDFYKMCPPLEGSTLQLGDEDVYDDISVLMDSTKCVRNEFQKQWQEQFSGAYQPFGGQTLPKQEDFVLPPLLHENDFGPLPTLVQLPSPPTASQSHEENDTESSCVSSSNNNFTTIRLRTRPSSVTSPAVGTGYSSPYTASRRVLLQQRGISFTSLPHLAGESNPKSSAEQKLSDVSHAESVEPGLIQSLDGQALTLETSKVHSDGGNSRDNSWATNVIPSPAPEGSSDERAVDGSPSRVSPLAFAPMPRKRVVQVLPVAPKPISEGILSVHKTSSEGLPSVVDFAFQNSTVDEVSAKEVLDKDASPQEIDSGNSSVTQSQKVTETVNSTEKSLLDESNSTRIMGLRLLEPICALRDFSASGQTPSKQKMTSRELPPGIGSIHVNAVTVTCSCSSAGLPHVPTKACACYSTFWEGRCEKEKPTKEEASGGQVSETANSPARSSSVGFVMVGVVLSLLCVQLFYFCLARSADLSRVDFLLSFRDLLFLVIGAVFCCLVQWRPMRLMRLLRHRRVVNSRPPS